MTSSHAIFREAPQTSPHIKVTLHGHARDPQMRFFLWKDVMEELSFAASYHAPHSLLCVVTGLYGLAKDGPFLEITGFQDMLSLPELDEQLMYAHVKSSLESIISDRSAALDAIKPGGIGFMLHLPGSQGELDDAAIRLHLSLFNVPYQFIIVLDVEHDCMVLYTRRPQTRFFPAAVHMVERVASPKPLLSEEE